MKLILRLIISSMISVFVFYLMTSVKVTSIQDRVIATLIVFMFVFLWTFRSIRWAIIGMPEERAEKRRRNMEEREYYCRIAKEERIRALSRERAIREERERIRREEYFRKHPPSLARAFGL